MEIITIQEKIKDGGVEMSQKRMLEQIRANTTTAGTS